MTPDQLFAQMVPSTYELALATGVLAGAILTLLVQRAVRLTLDHQRAERQRERLARIEARWHEAAMAGHGVGGGAAATRL